MSRWMTQDRWTAVVCLAIAVCAVIALPSQTSDRPLPGVRGFEVLDGAFFPKIAIALFSIAAIWLFLEGRPKMADPQAGGGSGPGIQLREIAGAGAITAALLLYVQVFEWAGYLATTIVAVCLLAIVCGQRSGVGLFFGGVVFPAVVYLLFSRVFLVPLPRGVLGLG